LGALLLNFAGRVLISEVIREVTIDKREEPSDAKLGISAPYFELENLDGKKVKITDFLDKPLVLMFWTAWNGASADQIKILDDFQKSDFNQPLIEVGLHIITINSQEDKSIVANFVSRGGYKVETLLDESGAVTELYGARNLPVAYFIDKDGVIKEIFIGVLNEKMLVEKSEKLYEVRPPIIILRDNYR